MAKAKGKKYLKNGGPGAKGNGGDGGDDPTEAVFRVDLKTGQMRITNQRGDELPEDKDVTPARLAEYGIEPDKSTLLAVIFYAKCKIKHGGCVVKIVNGRQVLIW